MPKRPDVWLAWPHLLGKLILSFDLVFAEMPFIKVFQGDCLFIICLVGLWGHPHPAPVTQTLFLKNPDLQFLPMESCSFNKDWYSPFGLSDISMHKWLGVFMTFYLKKKKREKTCCLHGNLFNVRQFQWQTAVKQAYFPAKHDSSLMGISHLLLVWERK